MFIKADCISVVIDFLTLNPETSVEPSAVPRILGVMELLNLETKSELFFSC